MPHPPDTRPPLPPDDEFHLPIVSPPADNEENNEAGDELKIAPPDPEDTDQPPPFHLPIKLDRLHFSE